MSDDYAGGHHFQLESAVADIQEQMARFQKAEQERQFQLDAKMRPTSSNTNAPTMVAHFLALMEEATHENAQLIAMLIERLELAGVMRSLPAPYEEEEVKVSIPFALGQRLDDFRRYLVQQNRNLRFLLEQLAL